MKFNRPGFYVEERYFGNNEAQAEAFARYRAKIFGRHVSVKHQRSSAQQHAEWVATFSPPEAMFA